MLGQPTAKDWIDAANNPGSDAMIPFSNGSEEMSWSAHNCDKCRRSIATRQPDTAPLQDFTWFERQVLDGQECGAKLCLDYGMVSGVVHKLVSMWMGGTEDELPSRCRHIEKRRNWVPPPPPEPVRPEQIQIPFRENYPLIDLDGLVITSQGLFEEADINKSHGVHR